MEKYLYLMVNIFTILVPLIYTFRRDLKFYSKLRYFLPAMMITLAFFITWDIVFTKLGVWGFNPRYLTGIYIVNLPLEEWLFFITVPYACVFTYEALNHLVKKDYFAKIAVPLSWVLIVGLTVIGFLNSTKIYTFVTFLLLAIFLLLHLLVIRPNYLGRFYFAWAILTVAFLVVNGILTGAFTPEPVVWYDNSQNLGIRIFTIPVEDKFFGIFLILMNITIYEKLKPAG